MCWHPLVVCVVSFDIPALHHLFFRRQRRRKNEVKKAKEEFLSGLVSTDRSNIFTAALHQVAVTSAPRATSLFLFFFSPPAFFLVQ